MDSLTQLLAKAALLLSRIACDASAMPSYQVTIVRPPRYVHTEGLRDVAEAVHFALLRLGVASAIAYDGWSSGRRPILLGAHLLSAEEIETLPTDAIVYNFEQITADLFDRSPAYRRLLETFQVWDYSEENAALYAEHGIRAMPRVLPVAYVPEWRRIQPAREQDVDVLFYGSLNARRIQILEEIRAAGLNVAAKFGVYGPERDALIARAKIAVNIHFYDAQVFEMPRVGFLLSNGVPVVAERGELTRIDPALADGVRAVPREAMADACVELAYDAAARKALGERGFAAFSARRLEDLLAPLVGAAAAAADLARRYPLQLNVGSGKDFRDDWLNIDVEARWRPDVVMDLSRPLELPVDFDTERLGLIPLCEGSYERLMLNDVLEHVPDLPTAMTNCLRLLKIGGELMVKVPYDLSYGAWQDPTHVRAFNERSFLYYTDWFWYLGWTDYRFDLVEMRYVFSPLGRELSERGTSRDEILRIPRAVDELQVRLRKRATTDDEREDALARRGGRNAMRTG